jgi:hypothetical protein
MKKIHLLLLFLVFAWACHRKVLTPKPVKNIRKINLTSIRMENLSEEITGNDEIQWIAWLIKDTIPSPVPLKKASDTLTFYKKDLYSDKKVTFEHTFETTRHLTLLVLLLEIDTRKTPEERVNLIEKELQKANYQPYDSLQTRLSNLLRDDDLLGISFYNLSDLQNQTEGNLHFSGIHLFDKFQYRIRYKME